MGGVLKLAILVPTLLLTLLLPTCVCAQTDPAKESGRVVLVLPFDNRSGNPNLNWIGDSFPDTLNQRLGSASFLTISRDDRQYALDHLGLPVDFRPTRATTIRIAQTLDADYVIVGSYNVAGGRIQVQAQVLETDKLRLSAPLQDSAELPRLFDIENAVAWKVARQIDPQFPVAQQTFLAASAGIKLSAFENYIRGTSAATPTERVQHLQGAVADSPNYAAAELALGKELYTDRDYTQAAVTLAKVPVNDRLALEAGFYRGLARFNDAKYAEAEQAFAFVAARLPLPEVVNDQGVAQSRQGKDGLVLFQRASNADPNDPDYHYNLAVSFFRRGDFANAGREDALTLKLRSTDTEATELRNLISAGRAPATPKLNGAGFDPTTRLRRTYSEASYRQAAFQMDQMRALRLSALPPAKQAVEYVQAGQDHLTQGLLPEAESDFHAATNADPANAAAHLGLAQIREQSGNPEQARAEAQTSLRLAPSAAAYNTIARLDLQANNLQSAATNVKAALALEPQNSASLGLRQALQARGQSLP